MSKLGYTWYPKDWGNSESVFELNLSERGLYRELIDLAMLNDNKTEVKLDVWIRKFSISIEALEVYLENLNRLGLIKIDGEKLFIPSCESRLKLVRGGSKGGKKSKPTSKPTPKPFESLYENNPKPTPKQIEIETKIEIESKVNINESLLEIFFKDLPNSRNFETICRDLGKSKEIMLLKIPEFRKVCNVSYPSFNDFCNHFKRLNNKILTQTTPTKKRNQG